MNNDICQGCSGFKMTLTLWIEFSLLCNAGENNLDIAHMRDSTVVLLLNGMDWTVM